VDAGRKYGIEPIKKMVGPLAPKNGMKGGAGGVHVLVVVIIALLAFGMGMWLATWRPKVLSLPMETATAKGWEYAGTLMNRTQVMVEDLPLSSMLRK